MVMLRSDRLLEFLFWGCDNELSTSQIRRMLSLFLSQSLLDTLLGLRRFQVRRQSCFRPDIVVKLLKVHSAGGTDSIHHSGRAPILSEYTHKVTVNYRITTTRLPGWGQYMKGALNGPHIVSRPLTLR